MIKFNLLLVLAPVVVCCTLGFAIQGLSFLKVLQRWESRLGALAMACAGVALLVALALLLSACGGVAAAEDLFEPSPPAPPPLCPDGDGDCDPTGPIKIGPAPTTTIPDIAPTPGFAPDGGPT
jgi:hypothetical protein